jgi:hypothetical protein
MRAKEGMVENAHAMGTRFLAGLRQINSSAVKEVRGRGLMTAIELHPEAGGGRRYCDALRLHGVLCKDIHEHTIRVSPPLVITRDEVDWALDQFDAALRQPAAVHLIDRSPVRTQHRTVARRPTPAELKKSWRRARKLGLKFETTTFERCDTLGMPALLEM